MNIADLAAEPLCQYGYDPAGNRTFKTTPAGTTTYGYVPATDRLDAATGVEQAFYAHDAYGNRIWTGPTSYAGQPMYRYDEANRLVEVRKENGDFVRNYEYDAFGRLAHRNGLWTFSGVRVLFWDQSGRPLEGILNNDAGGGGMTFSYVWVEGELLGRVDRISTNVGTPLAGLSPLADWAPGGPSGWPAFALVAAAGGTLLVFLVPPLRRRPRWAAAGIAGAALGLSVGCPLSEVPDFFWFHTDPLGTPLALSRTTDGAVVLRASYAPFGQATLEDDPDGDGRVEDMFVRLPGQLSDWPAGIHYKFFRTYDPQTGRYLEPDPIGQLGGLNVYAYAANNPIGLFDSMGLDSYLVC